MNELRVLHVDDEPDIRELVEISLGLDQDLTVKSCCCGKDAIITAAEWLPDIILMDVMMPIMDGPETLSCLRELQKTAAIPVVFMTARAQARELTHFLSLGAAGVIRKPFDPMALAGMIKQYLISSAPDYEDRKRRFIAVVIAAAEKLAEFRVENIDELPSAYAKIENISQPLLVAGKTYGLDAVESAAMVLQQTVENARAGRVNARDVVGCLGRLIETIERDCGVGKRAAAAAQSA